MANQRPTFSESWHRVADLKVALRPSVEVRKQLFRGQVWYLLQDPFSNNYYRLRPEALDFIKRLRKPLTIAQVWAECLEVSPATAPGQEEVIQLLAQLYHANLLYCELPIDSQQLFARYQKQQQRELRSKFFNLMFLRIPLFDPSRLLDRYQLLVKLLVGRWAALLWVLTLVWAGKSVLENSGQLLSEVPNLFQFNNLLLFYGGLLVTKTLHEFGHTLVCRKYGGEVHSIGVMLILFSPLPYMDATASWAFQDRRQRIMVAASGMLFEFFAAACAALLWVNTGPGIVHGFALNMMVVASVSTLVFNLNPLLKYDGYYILSDLLDIPNLQERSVAQLKYLADRWLFGNRAAAQRSESTAEACWLSTYALLSWVYRILVYGTILLFVADRYLLLGVLLATLCIFNWGLLPLGRFVLYLFGSSQLAGRRWRAITVCLGGLFLFLCLLAVLPVPHSFRAPGIVVAESIVPVLTETAGQLLDLRVNNGVRVEKGAVLAVMNNPELELEKAALMGQQVEIEAQLQQSIAIAGADTQAILEQQLANIRAKLQRLAGQQQGLTITAPAAGLWVDREAKQLKEAWLKRGTLLGQLVVPDRYNFSAVISQEEATNLFDGQKIEQVGVRLTGQSAKPVRVSDYQIIPFQQQQLPSAALGWKAGGAIAVSADDQQGLQTLEPYFRIDAVLESESSAVLNHGHSGQIRFDLPAEPLLSQLLRLARQFFQKRYQS